MKIIVCDMCKKEIKEIGAWCKVSFEPSAFSDEINVSHLITLGNNFDLCVDCANKIQKLISRNESRNKSNEF